MESYDVDSGDTFIRVFDEGEGKLAPILLVSGFIGLARFWTPVMPGLSKNRRVVSFDQRGTGSSGTFATPLTMEQMADDALLVLLKMGQQPVHLIGHSAGAGVGILLAAKYPHLIASLTLIGGWTKADLWMKRVFQARLDSLDSKGALAYIETTTLFMLPARDLRAFEAPSIDEEQRSLISFPGPSRIAARAEAVLGWDSSPFSSKVKCPTLIVGSTDDCMTPFYFSEDLAREIRGSFLHRLDEGGHYCVRSRPIETLQPILKFLVGVDYSRATE